MSGTSAGLGVIGARLGQGVGGGSIGAAVARARSAGRTDLSQTRRRGDRGSGSVWVLTVGLVTVLVATLLAVRGTAVVARHRAAAAADFAALAAALHAVEGPRAACSVARDIAGRNGAHLVGCRVDGAVARVRAVVDLPGVLRRWSASGTARAGPVGERRLVPRPAVRPVGE